MIRTVPITSPRNYQTWLVCGGRAFNDRDMFDGAMSDIVRLKGVPDLIVHGVSCGVDSLVFNWARKLAIRVHAEPADWIKHGRSAVSIRNQKMLDLFKVDLVVAFPGGRGTADMVRRARAAGISVAEISAKTVAAEPELGKGD